MRILLTNHHLQNRAGSELYCWDLATALRRAGHEVAVFTFQPGPIAEQMRREGIRIFTLNEDAHIEAFDPDLLHVHHAPCLYYLGTLRLRATALFSALGVIPALEAPPLAWEGVARGLAVSEEVRDAMQRSRFGAAVPITVFRNWFDDSSLARPAPQRAGEARRIAVVSNHLDARLRQDLEALCARRPGLSWTHFGLPDNSVEIGPKTLEGFDRVVTIGRTALLAAALQKPCLLYDVHGCDGLLTAERIGELATRNFSGRLTRARPSQDELEHLLLGEAQRVDVAALAEVVWRDFSLTRRTEELVTLYEQARQTGIALGESTRAAYGREGQVYVEVLLGVLHLQAHSEALRRELTEERARFAERDARMAEERLAMTARLEAASREAEALRATLETERTAAQATSASLAQYGQELAHLSAQLQSIESSLAWTVITRLRNVKDRMMAPGSRSRSLYERLLHHIKVGRSLISN